MGTAEVWRAFAPSQLSNVSVTGTLSQSVVSSVTVPIRGDRAESKESH